MPGFYALQRISEGWQLRILVEKNLYLLMDLAATLTRRRGLRFGAIRMGSAYR